MNVNNRILLIMLGLFIMPVLLTGQVEHLDDQIEKSAEILETDHDYAELIEEFIELAGKPVNLNAAKEEDLRVIPFLTPVQRKSLFDYIATYGDLLSLFELQSIPGFDSVLIRKIQPFISISPVQHIPSLSPKNLIKFGHHDLLLRYGQTLPKSAGYLVDDSVRASNPNSYYPGSPQRYYFRYNYSWFDKFRIGIAGEKDPGEQFFRGAQSSGMDFYSAFVSIGNIGILKNLTIGNFRASYGQGLTLGSGIALGSIPGFAMNIATASGIHPSLGISEGSYLRGLAATLKIKHIEIGGFGSYHPRDATVSSTDSNTNIAEEISSFVTTGYHRTPQEQAKKKALMELVCGGNINFNMAPTQLFGFKAGITGLYVHYSAALVPKIYPYNKFYFNGNHNLNVGFDYQLRYRKLYFFGEVSRSLNGGMAWLTGASLTPDSRVCMTLICRNYASTYQNLCSNAFGQNSLNSNEQGIYVAINAAVHPKLSFSGYFDLFTFPWIKYRVDAPTNGHEVGTMLSWQAAKNVAICLRFYQKNVQSNATAEPKQITHKLVDNITRSYRFNIDWVPDPGLLLKTRIEVKEAVESVNNHLFGYLVYQEVQIKPVKWLPVATFRFALFDIPGYNTRIYMYEPEVLYGYSVPAYEGRGIRSCMVLKFGVSKRIDIWLRGGVTYYTDRNEVGTGLDLTDGNIRSELTGQLLVRL